MALVDAGAVVCVLHTECGVASQNTVQKSRTFRGRVKDDEDRCLEVGGQIADNAAKRLEAARRSADDDYVAVGHDADTPPFEVPSLGCPLHILTITLPRNRANSIAPE
jgi:hypothetical protein